MNELIRDLLRNISVRFPAGSEAVRIKLILNDQVPFDYNEVNRHLENIINNGGSDKKYTHDDDKCDAALFMSKLKEACDKTDNF
jgi:hypothetical protein